MSTTNTSGRAKLGKIEHALQNLTICNGNGDAGFNESQSTDKSNKPDSPGSPSSPGSPDSPGSPSGSEGSVWDECFNRGEGLLCQSSPGANPPASPYQDYNALLRWGWTVDIHLPFQPPPRLPPGGVAALQGLGLATGLNVNIYVGLSQNNVFMDSNNVEQVRLILSRRSSMHADRTQRPTGGFYRNFYNPTQAVIIAVDNVSPGAASNGAPRPELGRFSDLLWLEWKHQCGLAGTNVGSLQYMVRSNIITGDTIQVIEDVLERLDKPLEPPPWDQAVEVPVGTRGLATREGTALLGTPHGFGVAYMLLQHRQFINKRIGSIVIYSTRANPNSPSQVNMLFKLVDVDAVS